VKNRVRFLRVSFATLLFLIIFSLIVLPSRIFASVDSTDTSLRYLVGFQDEASGALKEEFVDGPQSLETDWGIMAFSSSGYDSKTVGENKNLIDFALSDACSLTTLTDIERRTIALESAGIDTHALAACNLPEKILLAVDSSGRTGPDLVSTVFGAIALSSAGEPIPLEMIEYIAANQNVDGGWNSGYGAESNFTAQTIMALVSSKQEIPPEIIEKAKQYLKNLQTETGGIKYDANEWSIESDTFSDSYTLQAIYALGESPQSDFWRKNNKSIIDDLIDLRNVDGSYNFNRTYGKMSPVWTTSIALIGLNRDFLPIEKTSLSSWMIPVSSPTLTPSPSATVSPAFSPLPNLISTLIPTATPSISSTDTVVSVTAVPLSQSIVLSVVAVPSPKAQASQTPEPPIVFDQSGSKALSATVQGVKTQWQWIIVIIALSFFTGVLIKFIELKYVAKKN